MRRTIPIATVVATLVLVVSAAAAEPTRDEYVARVEPICKRNTEANRRIFAGAKEEVRAGKLRLASHHFSRAQTALEKTVGKLKAVPEPMADRARLGRWLSYLGTEADYIGRIGRALGQGKKGKAQTLSVRLNRNSNLANNTVLPLGFSWCRLDPSRFS